MTFQCDGCGDSVNVYGINFGMALDFRADQPDDPSKADHKQGHLCLPCRKKFREEILNDG